MDPFIYINGCHEATSNFIVFPRLYNVECDSSIVEFFQNDLSKVSQYLRSNDIMLNVFHLFNNGYLQMKSRCDLLQKEI